MPVPESSRVKFRADPTDPRHGTSNGYSNLKCRCEPCLEAGRAYSRLDKQLTKRFIPCPPELHGTFNGYCNYRCRCEPCVAAAVAQRATWASARLERAAGVRRGRYDGRG